MTNIGAGKIILARESDTPETFIDTGELYDPIPELDFQRDALDDTNTKATFERTKAGLKKVSALAFKIKTSADGAPDVKADWGTGKERRWKFTLPTDETTPGGVEEIIFTGWVSNYKLTPAIKDETFIMLTINVNEVEGM